MLKWTKDRASRKRNSRTLFQGQLDYQSLEPRQLLAVSAALSSGEFTLTGNLDRTIFTRGQGPLGNVDVVRAPIGHFAARVFEEPAEIFASLIAVTDLGRLSDPQVPIQIVWRGG